MEIQIVHRTNLDLLECIARFIEAHRPAGECLPDTPEGDVYFEVSFAVAALRGALTPVQHN
jgi:hypothetical protein